MSRPRIAFVSHVDAPFVREDVGLLGERFDVRRFALDARGGVRRLLSERAQLGAWLRAELPAAAAAVGWFADFHTQPLAAAARRRGVPCALVVGGYDAMRVPEAGHGVFASRWRAPLARRAVSDATVLLPVAAALVASDNAFLSAASRRQGLDVFAPGHAPAVPMPTGYDPDAWPLGPADRAPRVLTVGLVGSETRVWIKGIDFVVEAARRLPAVPFDVVGVDDVRALAERLRPPDNVAFHPPVSRETLAAWYQRASVYVQLSRVEGMPNVLCEAMLSGAVPVGTDVFGVPEALGPAGTVVALPDVAEMVGAIEAALAAPPGARRAARDHVASAFPRSRRRRDLHAMLDGLLDGAVPTPTRP